MIIYISISNNIYQYKNICNKYIINIKNFKYIK